MLNASRRAFAIAIGLTAAALLLGRSPLRAETSSRDVEAMKGASYIYIGTVRKDGNQSKNTPVWFITTKDNQVLIETSPTSWKAKRIRRGSPAIIWIGKADGPAFVGKTEIVTDRALQDEVIAEYPRKHVWALRNRPARRSTTTAFASSASRRCATYPMGSPILPALPLPNWTRSRRAARASSEHVG